MAIICGACPLYCIIRCDLAAEAEQDQAAAHAADPQADPAAQVNGVRPTGRVRPEQVG